MHHQGSKAHLNSPDQKVARVYTPRDTHKHVEALALFYLLDSPDKPCRVHPRVMHKVVVHLAILTGAIYYLGNVIG